MTKVVTILKYWCSYPQNNYSKY